MSGKNSEKIFMLNRAVQQKRAALENNLIKIKYELLLVKGHRTINVSNLEE